MKIYGDLITPLEFKFTVECKKGYNKESISSLFNPKSNFRLFIKQAETDSQKAKKDLMLILAQDRQDILVVVREQGFSGFVSEFTDFVVLDIQKTKYLILKLSDLLKLPDYLFI